MYKDPFLTIDDQEVLKMLPVITIAREYGSGGRYIGELTAQRLGIPFYDSAILDKVAEQSGFAKDVIAEQGEYVNQRSKLWSGVSIIGGFYQEDPQDQIFRLQSDTVQKLAAEGPCVIVGRCADYILEGYCDLLKVFVHSNHAFRAKRLREVYGENPKDINKYLDRRDRNRATYYKYYTEQEWGDFRHYHLNLDSCYLGFEQCVDIIVGVAQNRSAGAEAAK